MSYDPIKYSDSNSHYLIKTDSAYSEQIEIGHADMLRFMSEDNIAEALQRAREMNAVARFIGLLDNGVLVNACVQYTPGDE